MKTVARSKSEALGWLGMNVPEWQDKPMTVSIVPFKRDRTNPQNAKLHAMIRELALHCGYTERMMKDIVKAQYAPLTEVRMGEEIVTVPKGTSDMSVDEVSDLIEQLYQLGAELNCGFAETG